MILYLHGFASGPGSTKARALEERFGRLSVRLVIPDLTPGPDGFERSTPSSMLAIAEAALASAPPPHAVIGSSLGGWLAALAASRTPDVERLVLMAPAFRLAERWLARMPAADLARWKREGLELDHHASGRRRRIGWGFMEDALRWPAWPAVKVPVLCFAGTRDDVVPVADVERWVRQTPSARLLLLEDSHELVESVDRIFDEARAFLVPGKP
jgi:pimeloyl-ACP methyl ester carboxylesterase